MNKNKNIPDQPRSSYVLKCCENDHFIVYKPPFSIQEIHNFFVVREYSLGYAPGKLLELFVNNPNEVIDRDKIFSIAWPGRIVGQNSLNQAISSTRQLIGDEITHRAIKTVPRRGYIFDSAFVLDQQAGDEIIRAAELLADKELAEQISSNNVACYEAVSRDKLISKKYKSTLISILSFFLILLLSISFAVRVQYILISDLSYASSTIDFGRQKVIYIAPSSPDVEDLKKTVELTRVRLKNMSENSSHILFNKMHDFYNIICLSDRSAPRFITVNIERLGALTDDQLLACVK